MPRVLLALALPAVLVGCGSQVATTSSDLPASASEPASTAEPKGLTCPTDGRVGSGGGLLTEMPKGPATAEELVDANSTPEEPWVLAGRKAYVLRPDGTAFEVHDLVEGPRGWYLDGHEACAD